MRSQLEIMTGKNLLWLLTGLVFVSCGTSPAKKDSPLKITVTETINFDVAIFDLLEIDSIVASTYTHTQASTAQKNAEQGEDVEDAIKKHPFMYMLQPVMNESGSTFQKSAFAGCAKFVDTAKVIEMIKTTHVFPDSTRTQWVPSPPDLAFPAALVLYKPHTRQLTLTNADVDKIEYEEGERSGISGLAGISDTYVLTFLIKAQKPIAWLNDMSKCYLVQIELKHKHYFVSQSLIGLTEGLKVSTVISSTELDSLKQEYPNLLQQL